MAYNKYPSDFEVQPIVQDMGIGDHAPKQVAALPEIEMWRRDAQNIALNASSEPFRLLAQQVVRLVDHIEYLRERHQEYKREIYRSHYVPHTPAAKVDPA